MGTQKNRLSETVLLSTKTCRCLNLWVRKYLQFYAQNFCLSKPVFFCVSVFQCTPNELTNGVINACFMLQFKDLIRLFACYNDGTINLLGKYITSP